MKESNDPYRKLWTLIERHRFAMFATWEPPGVMRSRPMTLQEREFDSFMWFFAKADSAVVQAIHDQPQVCLSFGNSAQSEFVSVAGTAHIISDVSQKKHLWNTPTQAWFPQGPESPDVVLIQVTPDHGEYWDSSSSKLVQLFSMARAVAKSSTPEGLGEHQSVSM